MSYAIQCPICKASCEFTTMDDNEYFKVDKMCIHHSDEDYSWYLFDSFLTNGRTYRFSISEIYISEYLYFGEFCVAHRVNRNNSIETHFYKIIESYKLDLICVINKYKFDFKSVTEADIRKVLILT